MIRAEQECPWDSAAQILTLLSPHPSHWKLPNSFKNGASPAPPRPEIIMGSHTCHGCCLRPCLRKGLHSTALTSLLLSRSTHALHPRHTCPVSSTGLLPMQFPSAYMLFCHLCLHKHQPSFRCGPGDAFPGPFNRVAFIQLNV